MRRVFERVAFGAVALGQDAHGLILFSPICRPQTYSITNGEPSSKWLYGAMDAPVSVTKYCAVCYRITNPTLQNHVLWLQYQVADCGGRG